LCYDYADEPRMKLWSDEALKRDYRSAIALPLLVFGKAIGAFTLYAATTHFFAPEEIALLNEVAFDISFALESIETEKKRHEAIEALRQSLLRYETLFAKTSDGILTMTPDGKLVEVNDSYANSHGYSKDELLNMHISDFGVPEIVKDNKDRISRILAGETLRFETRHYHKNGHILTFEVLASTMNIDNKTFIISFERDITERKQAELELKEKSEEIEAQNEEYIQINQELFQAKENAEESEATYKMLFESISDAVFVSEIGEDGSPRKFIEVNDIACKRLGYTRQELLALSPQDINSEKSKQNHASLITNLIEKKRGLVEVEHVTKDGEIFPVEISTQVTTFRNKTVFYSIARDITERKKAELLYRSILNTTIDGFYLVDMEGRIIDTNESYCSMIGYRRDELLHMSVKDIDAVDTEEDIKKRIQQINDCGHALFETKHRCKDGRIINIDASVNVIIQEQPKLFCFMRDITERKKAELLLKEKTDEIEAQNEEYLQINEELTHTNQELIEAREIAEESNRLKTSFLQNMSHEIRTPMNAIMGFAQLLHDFDCDKTKIKTFTGIISQRSNDLLNIINDILDIAKIESGQLSLAIEECNLNELFTELTAFFSEYQRRMNKQNIKLTIKALCNPLDSIIVTDKGKLKQIFINLISNALKFTNEGTITGGCKLDENHKLVFYVSDTGIGIPLDQQKAVFERFTQLNQDVNKLSGGTGLGLSIVNGLVKLLGGEIVLESEPNKGSTFSFSFPYKAQSLFHDTIEFKKLDIKHFAHKTVLIVEDDWSNAEYLSEILSDYGLNLLKTRFGKEAVTIALSQPVDVVLMDIRLPDIDGYEASRQIKQHKPQIKIIAQTAFAADDEKQKTHEAGCDDYISKPTNKDLLLAMLSKYLRKNESLQ